MIALDHAAQKCARTDDRHLTVHHCELERSLLLRRVQARRCLLLPVKQDLRACGVQRRFLKQNDEADCANEPHDGEDELPLTPYEPEGFAQIEAFFGYFR